MWSPLADVICDTSFLMHMATTRVRNIDSLGDEIGEVSFVVPRVVLVELDRILRRGDARSDDARRTVEFARGLRTVQMGAGAATADDAILSHASARGGIVATMDRGLKRRLRERGCSIMSFSNDRIVLEP